MKNEKQADKPEGAFKMTKTSIRFAAYMLVGILILSTSVGIFADEQTTAVKAAVSGSEKSDNNGASAATEAETLSGQTIKTESIAQRYPVKNGVVQLTLRGMNNKIKTDNDEYQVLEKKVSISKRKLAVAMHDKYTADNGVAPLPIKAEQRVAWEKQKYTDWRYAEMDLAKLENDLNDKFESIKSDLKNQYTSILDLQKNLKTYEDEMLKLDTNITQLQTQINLGLAKKVDMDAYDAQKVKLEADMTALRRDIELAEFNLKIDLKIDPEQPIALSSYDVQFRRYDDKSIKQNIKKSVDNNFSVKQAEERIVLLKEERAIMMLWDREGAMMTNLQNNEVSIKEAEYSLINTRNTEEAGLWSDYYNVLNQEDRIEIENLNVKLAENNYNITVAKLAQGMVKSIDEQNARIDVEDAKTTLQKAINDYMRMVEDYGIRLR